MDDIQEHTWIQLYFSLSWHRLSANGLCWRRINGKKKNSYTKLKDRTKERKKESYKNVEKKTRSRITWIFLQRVCNTRRKNDLNEVTKQNWYKNVWSKLNTKVQTKILLHCSLKFCLKACELDDVSECAIKINFPRKKAMDHFFDRVFFLFYPLEVELHNVPIPSSQTKHEYDGNVDVLTTFVCTSYVPSCRVWLDIFS